MWQEFVHFLPNVAGASGTFDANGYYTRVLAGAGTQSVTGTALSKLPIIGQLVGEAPGGNLLTGVSPTWVGDLPPTAFRPAASCASQPLPNLAPLSAAPDLRAGGTPRAPRTTPAQARAMAAGPRRDHAAAGVAARWRDAVKGRFGCRCAVTGARWRSCWC